MAMGTPAYMSPEQADGNGLDVDTRSDVHSLGVMLEEAKLMAGLIVPPTPSVRIAAMRELTPTLRDRAGKCVRRNPTTAALQSRLDRAGVRIPMM